jgi:hypothetical protein
VFPAHEWTWLDGTGADSRFLSDENREAVGHPLMDAPDRNAAIPTSRPTRPVIRDRRGLGPVFEGDERVTARRRRLRRHLLPTLIALYLAASRSLWVEGLSED